MGFFEGNSSKYILAFFAGLGIGILIENKLYRGQQLGYFNEILLRLSYLEAEMKSRRFEQKKKRKKTYPSLATYNSAGVHSSSEEFYDAESGFDDMVFNSNKDMVIYDLGDSSDEQNSSFSSDEIDDLISSNHHEAAYDLCYQSLRKSQKLVTNSEFMWRWARSCYFNSLIENHLGNKEKSKELLYKADAASTQALELNTRSAEAHKWRAIILGKIIENASVKEKVTGGLKFRELIERGLQLNPQDPQLHDMMGRWRYEISKISWVERKTANYLFGQSAIPDMTVKDALVSFESASKYYTIADVNNVFWRAKCYLDLGNIERALPLLKEAAKLPSNSLLNQDAQRDALKLLEAYSPN